MNHRQVPIKVNAWVDEGIFPLVEALNSYSEIMTVSSCQGEDKKEFAHVYFHFCGDEGNTYGFIQKLSKLLGASVPGDNEYSISIQWMCGGEKPLIIFKMQPEVIEPLASAIKGRWGEV